MQKLKWIDFNAVDLETVEPESAMMQTNTILEFVEMLLEDYQIRSELYECEQ